MHFRASARHLRRSGTRLFTGAYRFHVLMPLYAGGCEQGGRGTTPFVIKLKVILSFHLSNFQVGAGPLGMAAPLGDG